MVFGSSKLVFGLNSRGVVALFLNQNRTFYNQYRHGPLKRHNPPVPYLKFLKEFFTIRNVRKMRDEIVELIRIRVKDTDEAVPEMRTEEETKIFEHFDTDEAIGKWTPKADSDTRNGFSVSRITRSPQGHALFYGILDNRIPDDGVTMKSGFACIMGPQRPRQRFFQMKAYWDWTTFNQIEMRVRGDGRRYTFVINVADHTNDLTWYDNLAYYFHTRGGPYWETITIPMSRLVFTSKNFIQDEQGWKVKRKVSFVAITLQDSYDGPFALEVDYIALQAVHTPYNEITAYEMYTFPHIKYRPLQVDCAPPEH